MKELKKISGHPVDLKNALSGPVICEGNQQCNVRRAVRVAHSQSD